MCAKNRDRGKPWECFLHRASEVRPSLLVHSNTLFTKNMAVIAMSVPAAIFSPNKKLKRGWWGRRTPRGGARPYRVRPLQLQWQSGRVGQVPGVHSPPARRHRLGVRGHAGTTASSKGRKWAGLPSRHHTLSSVSVSQEPVVEKGHELLEMVDVGENDL